MENRDTLIDKIAARLGISAEESLHLAETMSDIIAETCSRGTSVAIEGFGTFRPVKRDERIAMLPGKETSMLLPPKVLLTFEREWAPDPENTVGTGELGRLMSKRAGLPLQTTEDFLAALAKEGSDEIEKNLPVSLPGIGVFRYKRVRIERNGEAFTVRRISFTPTKEMAARVNSAFEMFEPVPLSEGVSEEMLAGEVASIVVEDVREPEAEVVPEAEPEPETYDFVENDLPSVNWVDEEPEPTLEETTEEIHEELPPVYTPEPETYEPEDEPEEESEEEPEELTPPPFEPQEPENKQEEKKPQSKRRFLGAFALGFGAAVLLLGIIGAIVHGPVLKKDIATPSEKTQTVAKDMASDTLPVIRPEDIPVKDDAVADAEKSADEDAVATPASNPEKVYDTITTTRYLTTMAKEHYGNYHLWCYIYEENKDHLGHPDRIKPGTKVVIPDLKKYGVDPNSPEDIAEAKRKGVAIYARYK